MSAAPARPKLAAERREVTGKKVSYIRAAGKLPAVVFGDKQVFAERARGFGRGLRERLLRRVGWDRSG